MSMAECELNAYMDTDMETKENPERLRRGQFRIDYDDDSTDTIAKIEKCLGNIGIDVEIADDDQPHDGYMIYNVKAKSGFKCVTQLVAENPNLAEYVAQLENQIIKLEKNVKGDDNAC